MNGIICSKNYNMKIVFNTDQIYLHGGIEKTIATKANYFVNLPDVEVVIVTTEQNGKPPCYPIDQRVRMVDIGINYSRDLSYFTMSNLGKVFRHFRCQKKLFNELQPDVVISPNFNFDHYWLPFLVPKAKLIKERHGSRYAEEEKSRTATVLGKIKIMLDDWIDARYDHIVVLNQDEKKYVKSDNAVVIPNSVSIPDATAVLKNKQVIAAGRISPVKGFDDLIQAWKIVNEKFPDWQLHIYGEDYLDTKARLKILISDLNLQNAVLFKESVNDLPATMTDYSIYAMSSVTECFPMVLLEALSVGLPIVSYDCPNGPRNILIDNEDGLLAAHKNPNSLAEKLMIFMSDERARTIMGINAKNNIERFSNETVMKLWHKLLNSQDV